jgi:hypothetical protein
LRKTENRPARFARLFVFVAYALALLCLAGLGALSAWKGIPTRTLTEDVGTVMKIPPYVGFLTNICVLLWCAASAACLLSYLVLRGNRTYKGLSRFFLTAGLFTGFLLLDDFFMFHDYLAGGFLPFPEEVFYVLYFGWMVLFFAGFARTILRTRYLILAVALLCLGLAIGIDHYQERLIVVLGSQVEYLAEEGIKFLGVTGWFSYFVITCVETLRSFFQPREVEEPITRLPLDRPGAPLASVAADVGDVLAGAARHGRDF